jgi:hypothetical protein
LCAAKTFIVFYDYEIFVKPFISSWEMAVMNCQFWRQLHCRQPAVQLLTQPSRQLLENPLITPCHDSMQG